MKIEFLKNINEYKVGDVVDFEYLQAKAYIEMKKAKMYIYQEIKILDKNILADKTYKELRNICKSKGLPAVGSKESLILSLIDKGSDNNALSIK